jgi:hypothetical protein
MATYLQGVTDYIPEFQPFQPDLNFYNNLLQTKQTQFDNNWKAINKIYGQYFYSDLSRKDNMEIKDQLMKNIDFNLKRISGLDLSLDQNVEQAAQVFKPFYEDKFLMKDMAYTKNYLNQRSRGTSLKNSKDKEDRKQYWDTGIKELDYRREEFKNVSREETLNIGNTNYTPYVNALDVYAEVADKWGISADITAPDASGMYMVRKKNGDQIIPALQTLFQAYGANDAQLQQVYFTQAYVNRKDAVYQNAAKFDGDINAAERDYLAQANKTISDYAARKKADYDALNQGVKKEKDRVENMKSKNEDNIFTDSYLDRLNEAAGYTEAAANNADNLNSEVNDQSVTDATTGGSFSMDEDLETQRRKVDAGIASMLMDADINQAAYSYSRKDMIYNMKESQLGLESIRQKNRLAAISAKAKADEWNIILKQNLKNGTWLVDENGDVYKKDLNFYNPNPVNVVGEEEKEGEETKRDIEDENKYQMDETARKYAGDWTETAVNFVQELTKNKLITKEQAAKIFSLDFSSENYSSAREAGKDILNDAGRKTVSTGKGILAKLVQGFGIDQRVDQVFGKESGNSFRQWLTKDDTKVKSPNDKQEDGSITKILDAVGVTAALGKLYYYSPDDFYKDYKKNPSSFLYGQAESIGLIKNKVDYLASAFRGDGSSADNYIESTIQSGQMMDKFIMHANAVRTINLANEDAIHEALKPEIGLGVIDQNKIDRVANLFYSDGTIMDKDKFIELAGNAISNQRFSGLRKDMTWISAGVEGLKPNERALLNKELNAANLKAKKLYEEGNLRSAAGPAGYSNKYEFLRNKQVNDIQANFVAKVYGLDPETGSPDRAGALGRLYDDLLRTYNNTIKDPNKIQILTPLIQDVMTSGGRAAVYSKGESGVEVHLSAPQTFKPFVEFVQNDMRNIKFGDINNTAISVLGTSKTAFTKSKEQAVADGGAQRDLLYRVVNDLYADISNNSKTKPFRFTQRQVAGENRNLGAMVIYPDKEFMDKYKANKEGVGGLPGDVVDNILRYGISVIAPRQNFTNSLFNMNEWTPMQIAVNAQKGKPVTLYNNYGAGKVDISKVTMGAGDYNIQVTANEIKADGSIVTRTAVLPRMTYGNNLDNQAQQALDNLMLLSAQNNQIYQGLSPEQKRKVSQSGVFRNIPVALAEFEKGAWDIKSLQRSLTQK